MIILTFTFLRSFLLQGPSRITWQVINKKKDEHGNVDEIANFENARIVNPFESATRIFDFPIGNRSTAVEILPVHADSGQLIKWRSPADFNKQLAHPPDTELIAYYHLNSTDQFARTLLYSEIPQHNVWNKKTRQWTRRKQGDTIGRLAFISPTGGHNNHIT